MILAVIPPVSGQQQVFTVTNLNDFGPGSLRQAISDANSSPGLDRIEFDPSLAGTIFLSAPLHITEGVEIDGSTAGGPITIDGGGTVSHAFAIVVWWGSTKINQLTISNFVEYGVIVTQGLDTVTLRNLRISDCGFGGIIVIRYAWGASSFNVIIDSSQIINNRGVGIAVRASGVTIQNSLITQNDGAGIYVTVDATNFIIQGPTVINNIVIDNGAEGIVMIGAVTNSLIQGNAIEYNDFGGVTLASDNTGGPQSNIVTGNRISFNDNQDVAVVGEDSDSNEISGNTINSDPLSFSSLGIVVRDGADGNIIASNEVTGHRYEGVVVLGGGTDNNVVSDNVVTGNGAGILVGNAAAPDINYPFPVYGRPSPGPDSTTLNDNIVANNLGAGIILISTTNVRADTNIVDRNALWGFYWVGSSGTAFRNFVSNNGADGFRVEPYYGVSALPDPPHTDDDVLSTGSILDNRILLNRGYGIRFLDNPRLDTRGNVLEDNTLGDLAVFWLGYGRIRDQFGNPVVGRTIALLKNDGDTIVDYVWSVSDSNGRYGPTGFVYNNIATWEHIIAEEELKGSLINYNPYAFRVDGNSVPEIYSWNGIYPDPATESGGAIESPSGSGVDRYQFVLFTLVRPSLVGGEVEPPLVYIPLEREADHSAALFTAILGVTVFAAIVLARSRRKNTV
ncbi:MAG: right-handed parallel beta-helix repeat-containing protein [Candidatus Caldarchaeum sp.]|nr:right-handed parallel beta-helix repeat-containing protein [Candidatus Caldarchaeum sp.]